ncbi:crAss001_48 related protein [Burkholderia vietnamiensis]|uniref:crAss001_48 related protein n=1 Tax=Burkholderia vietnamiensis TaxID=60552 RepID=UPI00265549FC|nr:hypothetical protein [Burkholderia vietnamiensis]MDN8037420.1 hypothetical protein [Burkholderia vietnamiensis]
MQAHQQRVVDEKLELDERLGRLNHFIAGPVFGTLRYLDAELMRHQAHLMTELSDVLGARIARFTA